MKCAVITFPGSNCDQDCLWAMRDVLGVETSMKWHRDTELGNVDVVIIPGGFSYGDYLRTGALARFSPIMQAVKSFVDKGGKVLGICNGFQILLENNMLPGAMIKNKGLSFLCKPMYLKTVNAQSAFTSRLDVDQVVEVPIAHYEGNYYADAQTIEMLEAEGRVAFRYCDANGVVNDDTNPNGSINSIAGILNKEKNVLGMMPHPERAVSDELGSRDGLYILGSLLDTLL